MKIDGVEPLRLLNYQRKRSHSYLQTEVLSALEISAGKWILELSNMAVAAHVNQLV